MITDKRKTISKFLIENQEMEGGNYTKKRKSSKKTKKKY